MKYISLLCLCLYFLNCNPLSKNTQTTDNQSILKIAYSVFFDKEKDDYEVFIMDLDGSNQKNISNWEGVDWADYSYKNKIYFISDRDTTHRFYFLWEMDGNGENLRKVSDIRLADSRYSSRKNNTEFIVRPHKSVDSVFYIINSDGKLIQKADSGLPAQSDPYFSPDGNQIVFRGGTKRSKRDEGFREELFVMNSDGSNLTQITRYPEQDTTAEWFAYKAGPPVWHPNGTISYASKQKGNYSLFATDVTGKTPRQLTSDERNEVYHKWSPDGKLLVYEASDENDSFEIYLLNVETGEEKQLTKDTISQFAPVFVEF